MLRGIHCVNMPQLFLCSTVHGVWVGLPGGSDRKESACNEGDTGSTPGSGRSPGEGNGYPLQHSCLENSIDRKALQTTVHGVTKSWTQLSNFHFLQSPYKPVPVHCLYLMSWKGWMNWLLKVVSNLDTLKRRVLFKRAVKVDVIVKWTITIPFPPFSQVSYSSM